MRKIWLPEVSGCRRKWRARRSSATGKVAGKFGGELRKKKGSGGKTVISLGLMKRCVSCYGVSWTEPDRTGLVNAVEAFLVQLKKK